MNPELVPLLATSAKAWWAIGSGVAALVVVIRVLRWSAKAAPPPAKPPLKKLGTDFFFWLTLFYLVALLAIAIMYMGNFYGVKDKIPVIVANIMPIGIPWFGAVGAVVIGFEGLFQHNKKWDDSYNYWHIARPLFGAVLGVVAFFLFLLIINAAGSKPQFSTPTGGVAAKDLIIYYVVAFLVGYREETFRQLVKRATDLVLAQGPKEPDKAPEVTFEVGGATVSIVSFDDTPVGLSSAPTTVTIYNTGQATLEAPVILVATDQPESGQFAKADPSAAIDTIEPGQSATVDVIFRPTSAGKHSGTLTVASTDLASPASLGLSGNTAAPTPTLPEVSGLLPKTGSATGNEPVVITGTGFLGATVVSFGATPALSLAIDSDTQITVGTPPGTGTVEVTVTTPVGTSPTGAADLFTYT